MKWSHRTPGPQEQGELMNVEHISCSQFQDVVVSQVIGLPRFLSSILDWDFPENNNHPVLGIPVSKKSPSPSVSRSLKLMAHMGVSIHWGTPKWMVYNGKLGVPVWLRKPPYPGRWGSPDKPSQGANQRSSDGRNRSRSHHRASAAPKAAAVPPYQKAAKSWDLLWS